MSAFIFISVCVFGQIERVNVETYYISDKTDATDTIGGHLEEGSTTYRIFVSLLPGTKILSIYAVTDHPLVFTSTHPFFNHREEGISFGKDLNRSRYEIGTVALDTYITIGQCSKSFSQGAYFGIPKESDPDASQVGGVNNDGGSQAIASGLLINAITQLGIPLTTSDGLVTSPNVPDSWIDIGFINILTDQDTTMFGSHQAKSGFLSYDALLRNSGVQGVDTTSNEVLIAQLTTKGEIAFELNLECEILKNGVPQVVKYVARNEMLNQQEVFSPLLKFPYICGCTDPDYVEASTTFACTDNQKCLTPIVLGCTDSLACNFNPDANVNLHELCCYVGYCQDLDLEVICPNLKPRDNVAYTDIRLFPNPTLTDLNIEVDWIEYSEVKYTIYDITGQIVDRGSTNGQHMQMDVSILMSGVYVIKLHIQSKVFSIPFIKI